MTKNFQFQSCLCLLNLKNIFFPIQYLIFHEKESLLLYSSSVQAPAGASKAHLTSWLKMVLYVEAQNKRLAMRSSLQEAYSHTSSSRWARLAESKPCSTLLTFRSDPGHLPVLGRQLIAGPLPLEPLVQGPVRSWRLGNHHCFVLMNRQ